MLNDIYKLKTAHDLLTFEFVSIGPKGSIIKAVEYSETVSKDVYNLGFGDKDVNTNYIDDLVVTDNRDGKKVLATVAFTLYLFTNEYPDATVLAAGSTDARTRLYQMGISNNLEAIKKDFVALGFNGTDWEPFERNISYKAFLVRRKM